MRDFGQPMLIVFYQIITKDYLTFKIIYHKEFFKLSVLITSSRYLRTDYEQIFLFHTAIDRLPVKHAISATLLALTS